MAQRVSLAAIPLIAGLIASAYLACIVGTILLGLPWDLSLPWPLRILGVLLIAAGSVVMAAVFRFRGFGVVLDSTYATLMKLLGRAPMTAPAGWTEPLAVAGPYRFVRHPLYSGVIAQTFGIGLAVDHLWAILGAVVVYLWFALVLAPFEERELCALFGKPYEDYMRTHRRFLPIPRQAR